MAGVAARASRRLIPYTHVPMKPDCRKTLLVLLNLCIVQVIANSFPETFDEELVLRPERDGKLVSRFAFTTMIEDAYPRDPQTLGLEDHGSYP